MILNTVVWGADEKQRRASYHSSHFAWRGHAFCSHHSDLYLTEQLQRSTHPTFPGCLALRGHSVHQSRSASHDTAVRDMLHRELMLKCSAPLMQHALQHLVQDKAE